MPDDCCERCIHFSENADILRTYGAGYGLCRFGPPVVAAAVPPDPPVFPPAWPVVALTFWCPAFRPAE
jgi:hypothetical protein